MTIVTKSEHLDMLCDIGELQSLLAGSKDIDSFLRLIVEMVARHLGAAVCSIYLFERSDERLTLRATCGLRHDCVGRIVLGLGEGLVGYVMERGQPVCEATASQHPRFKAVPELAEESFEAFLAVPILRGIERIGVLVVQREAFEPFTNNDLLALKATASQLAGAIENARVLIELHTPHAPVPVPPPETLVSDLRVVHAKVASEGFAYGPVSIVDKQSWRRFFERHQAREQYSLADFHAAVVATEEQLEALQARVEEKLSDVASLIFEAHILMLKDPEFTGEMTRRIECGVNPPDALITVASQYIEILSTSANAYTREKAKDVEDLAVRLYSSLVASEYEALDDSGERIVVARELYPSDMLKLSSENVGGIILVSGGVTSHLSILASSLRIPMVIADEPRLLNLDESSSVLLDAEVGSIHCSPTTEFVASYLAQREARAGIKGTAPAVEPTTSTSDGTPVHLLANINLLADVQLACEMNAEGIGLYRTEFPFLVRSNFPTEEEQLVVYTRLVEMIGGRCVTIRTLDIGGDKALAYYDSAREENPTLGMRSIRFSFEHVDVFHQQIRAILRAGVGLDELRIMFPMISSVDEFIKAREAVQICMNQLSADGVEHHTNPAVGLMIEIPSVVDVANELAQEADFFCIGTNDFIQFMLAVDRTNAKVASYYLPHHPAILRGLARVAGAACRQNIDVSVCGEMAHDERYIPFFLGVGIRTLSLDPGYLPRVQRCVNKWQITDAERYAQSLLAESTVSGIEALLA